MLLAPRHWQRAPAHACHSVFKGRLMVGGGVRGDRQGVRRLTSRANRRNVDLWDVGFRGSCLKHGITINAVKSNKVPPNMVFKIKTKERVTAGQRGFLPNMLAGVKGQPPPPVYSCVGQLKGPTWSPSCRSGSDRLALETVVGQWPPPPNPPQPPQSQHPSSTPLLTPHAAFAGQGTKTLVWVGDNNPRRELWNPLQASVWLFTRTGATQT